MKRSLWRRPSPALVIACLALFVALGGTVVAATKINGKTIIVKSLPGNRLEVASVPGNRLMKGTIPGNRIAPGSLKGDQIDVGTLGQVPSAAHADSADTARRAQTAAAADHAADASTINGHSIGCAQGRREYAGACWDVEPSTASMNALEAVAACATQGGELPAALSLLAFAREPGVHMTVDGEWTGQLLPLSDNLYDVLSVTAAGELLVGPPTQLRHFRCVTPLVS
jgi:hypothetical protein